MKLDYMIVEAAEATGWVMKELGEEFRGLR